MPSVTLAHLKVCVIDMRSKEKNVRITDLHALEIEANGPIHIETMTGFISKFLSIWRWLTFVWLSNNIRT